MERFDDPRAGCAGYNLIELVISSVLLAMMVFAVATLSVRGGEAQDYARRLNRATEINQELVDGIRLELVSSVRLFGNDAEGLANLAVFDLSGAPTPLVGSRLPTVSDAETIRKDTLGDEITGNALFFTKLAWSDRFQCTSTNEYLVEVYRWVLYYLTPEEGGPAPGSPLGLNIVRVLGEPMIDADSIDRITDPTDQAEVLLHLHDATPDATGATHAPAEVVWRRGALPSVTGTLRQIDGSSGTLSDVPIDGRPNPWQILRAESDVRGLLSYRHHSIATVHAQDSWGVSRFGLESLAGSGFPHGFEIQVVGPSSARQVLLHSVVASTRRSGFWAWSDMQVVVDARDL